MRFLTYEKLGPKQALTPEGFLICHDVPIARIGLMDYHEMELPDVEAKDGVIQVERTADVVFSPETIASFLGKPATIDHPYEPVTPVNWRAFAVGTATNIRRGDGSQSDLLLADLLITDQVAIEKIRSKELTEVSCGYDSEYVQIAPGRARQATIVGNHVALVKNARCGPVCSIGDSSKHLSGDTPMAAKKGAQSIKDALRRLFMTKDSEGFEKVLSEVNDEELSGGQVGSEGKEIHIHVNPAPGAAAAGVKETTDQDPPGGEGSGALAELVTTVKGLTEGMAAVQQNVAAIGQRVSKLEGSGTTDADPDDPDGNGTTTDDDPDDKDKQGKGTTNDSARFREEFQDAMSRAEILAPGVKLPTFDGKAPAKKTSDSLCVLRRRALRAAADGDHEDLVTSLTGGADLSKMTCDSVKTAFMAASEVVKHKNAAGGGGKHQRTADGDTSWAEAQNKRNAEFWSNRK
ncbi:DUF2213 domain-containing protein [Cupriavidus basilensis]